MLQSLGGIILIALGAIAAMGGVAGTALGVPDVPPVLHPRKIAAGVALAGLAAYAAGSIMLTDAMTASL